jgi:hypothetical protein
LTKGRKAKVVFAFPEARHLDMLAGLTTEGDTGMKVAAKIKAFGRIGFRSMGAIKGSQNEVVVEVDAQISEMGPTCLVVVTEDQVDVQVGESFPPLPEAVEILVYVAVKHIAQQNQPSGRNRQQHLLELAKGFHTCLGRESETGFPEMGNLSYVAICQKQGFCPFPKGKFLGK